MQLSKKIFIEGKIIAKSGLHIGSKDIGLSIGSTDNTVIRHPITQQPYIPGSSLRGKMRTLLERFEGLMGERMSREVQQGPYTGGKNGEGKDHFVCNIFGIPAEKAQEYQVPPSRLIVRDGELKNAGWLTKAKNTDMPFTEVKTEVVIDRITSAAMPRQLERVPSGAEFDLNLVLNIWDVDSADKEKEYLDAVFRGLMLLQDDYLGGHGSRGSGRIKIVVESLKERTAENYKAGEEKVARDTEIPIELRKEEDHENL